MLLSELIAELVLTASVLPVDATVTATLGLPHTKYHGAVEIPAIECEAETITIYVHSVIEAGG